MMPLNVAAMTAAAMSPSRGNACIVKLTPMNGMYRYRNDPYRASVIPLVEPSPMVVRRTYEAAPVLIAPPVAVPDLAPLLASLLPALENVAANQARQAAVAPAPVAAAPSRQPSGKTHYAVIKFKHDYATYIAPFKISIGDAVSVEGDRGENIGEVTDITTIAPDFPVTQRVTRHATKKDKDHLDMLRRKEAAATRTCQEIADQVGLSIKVVDTEYQFDMNKLTIFFASKVPIDFRKFQRELFREFRCRIWIVNWPRKPAPPTHAH